MTIQDQLSRIEAEVTRLARLVESEALTVSEFARKRRVSRQVVYRWIAEKRIRPLGGKPYMIPKSELVR